MGELAPAGAGAAAVAGGLDEAGEQEEVEVEFHGVAYAVRVAVPAGRQSLVVEVEERDTLDAWRGEFAARYLEDITSKAGSFKRFGVFVRMLTAALAQASDSVCADLLTTADLELLKHKKAAAAAAAAAAAGGAAPAAAAAPAPPPCSASSSCPPPPPTPHGAGGKRYLILTYASEFERVHYPLPLAPAQQADVGRLRALVRGLRAQLQQERDECVRREQQPARAPHARGGGGGGACEVCGCSLRPGGVESDAVLLSSRLEVAQAELQRARAESRRELRRKAHELAEVQGELCRSRDLVREQRARIKALEAEVDTARRRSSASDGRGVAAAGTGPGRQRHRQPQQAPGSPYWRGGAAGSLGAWGPPGALPRGGGSSNGGARAGTAAYLSGGPPLGKFPSRAVGGGGGGGGGASRGPSPARSSRGASPGYSRPWAQGPAVPSAPRPSSAPPRQRFDPTEYVRQKQQRLAGASPGSQRAWGSGGGSSRCSSRSSSPARSASAGRGPGSSASGTPRGALSPAAPPALTQGARGGGGRGSSGGRMSQQGSLERRSSSGSTTGSRLAAAAAGDQALFGPPLPGSGERQQHQQQRRASVGGRSGGGGTQQPLGQRAPPRAGLSGRGSAATLERQASPAGRAGAASPGRALQGVRDRLAAFIAKGQPAAAAAATATAGSAEPPATGPQPAGAGAQRPAGVAPATVAAAGVLEDAGGEIADIDQRLHALQDFLRRAKTAAAGGGG